MDIPSLEQANTFIDNLDLSEIDEDELYWFDNFNIEYEPAHDLISVLSIIGCIRTTQGTQRFYILDNNKGKSEYINSLTSLADLINDINTSLVDNKNSLTKKEVGNLITKYRFDKDIYYNLIVILSVNNIATSAGRSRTGGITLYNDAPEPIENARDEIKRAKTESAKENVRRVHEKTLYEKVAKFITEWGYQSVILGGNRRLCGEWNTPDIVGYRTTNLEILGTTEIEVITVEVKWEASKSGIAEANSHQRLSHSSYIYVEQELEEIDASLLAELLDKQIGLICLKNGTPVLHCAAKVNDVGRIQIDKFLSDALGSEGIDTLREEINRSVLNRILKIVSKYTG